MTFFTILAEGVFIIVFLRILSDPDNRKTLMSRKPFWAIVLFLLLSMLLFTGEHICGLLIDLNRGWNRLIYRVVVWDLMATLYALLEGIIAVLTCKLYFHLRARTYPGMVPVQNENHRRSYSLAIWLIVLGFTAGFCFFEYFAVQAALAHRLNEQAILNMAHFYRIITGWFWTFFEAAVALFLMKIYLMMKQEKE